MRKRDRRKAGPAERPYGHPPKKKHPEPSPFDALDALKPPPKPKEPRPPGEPGKSRKLQKRRTWRSQKWAWKPEAGPKKVWRKKS